MEKKRYSSLDFLRVLSCILVIGIHCRFSEMGEQTGFGNVLNWSIEQIVRMGLPEFFLLSSMLLMNDKNYIDNLGEFYLKKFFKLGVPFIICSIGYYYYSGNAGGTILLQKIAELPEALKSVFLSSQYYHLWYVYMLAGLYLLVPFLKKLLQALTFKQLAKLSILCLSVRILQTFLGISIGGFYFGGWVIYYIIGYTLLKEEAKKYYNWILGVGAVAFVFSIISNIIWPESVLTKEIWDLSPFMILCASALFVWFLKYESFFEKSRIKKMVNHVGKYTYLVYLLHPMVLGYVWKIIHMDNIWLLYLARIGTTFAVTLVISIVVDKILFKPLEKLLNKAVGGFIQIFGKCWEK